MDQQPSEERPLLGLEVDFDSGSKFNEAARWAKFIAIVIFIGIGLVLVSMLVAGPNGLESTFREAMPQYAGQGDKIYYAVLIVMAIYTYITILLYRFATLTRQAIQTQNQGLLTEGIRHLKRYFLIHGVFAILSIVYNIFGLITTSF
ncbi:hypothetical protein [Paraflavitalea pollutisoli]|uniref:hypothetical protein n=1 Tax=Paraflavitalea pollutisoli TaxID=3034143 RepID=UPI0023EE113C|nr:hypothetical protein [Paraflavitalea sp. H1-2-19X]